MWADSYIEQLRAGIPVSFRPRGNSMAPLVKNGEKVTIIPITQTTELKERDIVLCTVGSSQYLHLIKACSASRYQIGNNRGRINGWVSRDRIHGKLINVAP